MVRMMCADRECPPPADLLRGAVVHIEAGEIELLEGVAGRPRRAARPEDQARGRWGTGTGIAEGGFEIWISPSLEQ